MTADDSLKEPVTITAYRGEHGNNDGKIPIHTRLASISFGTRESAEFYAQSPNDRGDTVIDPRVITAEITIGNPAVNDPDDPFIDYAILVRLVGEAKAQKILVELNNHVTATNLWEERFANDYLDVNQVIEDAPERLQEIYFQAFPVFDDPLYVGWLKESGYDGAIHGGSGTTALETEYRVFSVDQIKIISVDRDWLKHTATMR